MAEFVEITDPTKARSAVGKDDGLWNPFGNDGMRHMENADVIGGATDETKGGQS